MLYLASGECGGRDIYIGNTEEIVELKTPGFPMHYRDELVCEWIVSAANNRRIHVEIIDFEMERGYDFLILGDGVVSVDGKSTLATLTGTIKLNSLSSGGSTLWIKVATDRTGTSKGFRLELKQLTDEYGMYIHPLFITTVSSLTTISCKSYF